MSDFWTSCIFLLRQKFDKSVFEAFISSSQADLTDDSSCLSVYAPNNAAKKWLADNISGDIQNMAKQKLGRDLQVKFSVQTDLETTSEPTFIAEPSQDAKPLVNRKTNLRNDLTFENFVPGQANRLALMVAREISSGNANQIGPLLFLYGHTGLGKTHLAQAVANSYLLKHPERQVRYVMARDFMADVVNACRLNRHDRFRNHYENLDLLIVDDIQYITGDKVRTQEEFFFIFNRLHDNNKIIIITSDCAPGKIRNLPDRLSSRLRSGMAAYLNPPEPLLRESILCHKARLQGVQIDEKVAKFIAERIKSSVRELEGALYRVLATAAFHGKPPSLEICQEALADLIETSKQTVNVDTIKRKTAEFFHLRVSDLSSKSRRRSIARPRHMAIYLCRHLTNLSLPEIGKHFGDREHTTVLHSCRTMEKELSANAKTQEEMQLLEMLVKST